jgi:peptide/nickel transport system substrate-binding protein
MLLLIVLASSTAATYGHGLGTDQALPVTVGETQLTVEATMTPTFVPIEPSVQPTLVIRAHDENDDETISGIDYRVVVELRNETILDQRFRSSDGIVAANLVPDSSIGGWQINGNVPPPQVEVSQGNPVELRSKIMSAGGLYHIRVTVESSSTGISLDSDQAFDLYVSIGRTYTFDVEGGQMVVKTYYDDIDDFSYSNETISFNMPFSWDEDYVSQVPVLHIEVQFPKTIEELQTNSYVGTLNGRELEAQAVVIDDYTLEQSRIVHFVVNNAMLTRFAETAEDDVAAFELKPADKPKFPLDIMSLPSERFLFQLSWGPDLIETGVPITFVMNLQDPATGDIVRGSSFDFVITQNGEEIHREHLSSEFGTYAYDYIFADTGTATLAASNINGQGESAKIDLVVLQGTGGPVLPPVQQPSGCLIATAAFGSELTPQVQYLRNFRDSYILSTASGSAFMNSFNAVYYSFSPQVADYERGQPWLQAAVKAAIYPLFGILTASEKAHAVIGGEAGAIMAGATASSLIGAVYLAPAGYVASKRVNNRVLAIVVGIAAAFLAVTLIGAPALLPISTAAFVVTAAGSSAITVAKLARKAFRR